jgi:chromosome segregation ATPase
MSDRVEYAADRSSRPVGCDSGAAAARTLGRMAEPGDADLAAELERLRELVGPSEIAYAQLRDDLDAASAELRALEAEVGALRGRQVEMDVQLARARQDQEALQVRDDRLRRLRGLASRLRRQVSRRS